MFFSLFFAHSILDRLLFMDMVVFKIAIPIVILRNTEVIKLSANTRWDWNRLICWNLLLHVFSIDLTVLRQLVCYQVLATLSGRCFLFLFTWDIFGAGVCEIEKLSQFFDFWIVSLQICIKTKNACHLESEVQNGCIKDHSIGGAYCGISVYWISRQPQGPDGILRLQVFCFLVKKEGHVNWVAGLT